LFNATAQITALGIAAANSGAPGGPNRSVYKRNALTNSTGANANAGAVLTAIRPDRTSALPSEGQIRVPTLKSGRRRKTFGFPEDIFAFEDESDRTVRQQKWRSAFKVDFREDDSEGGTPDEETELSRAPENDKEVTAGVKGLPTNHAVAGNIDVTLADITSSGHQVFAWGIECGRRMKGCKLFVAWLSDY
jgi:hypothetical protein